MSGRSTRGGCGSNVIAAGVPARSPARRRTRSMIFMWPRCSPSKLPSASTGWCQRGGGSSGKWAICIGFEGSAGRQLERFSGRARRAARQHTQHQPIIGQLHPGRQARAGGCVPQVVAHVREVGPPGADAARRPRSPRSRRNASGAAPRAARRGRARRAPRAAATTRPGMRLQSVRYANGPSAKPRIGRLPWKMGTGTTSWPADAERPGDREQLELRDPAAARRRRIEHVGEHRCGSPRG